MTLDQATKSVARAKVLATKIQGLIDTGIDLADKHDPFDWALAYSILAAAHVSYTVANDKLANRKVIIAQCNAVLDECAQVPWGDLAA